MINILFLQMLLLVLAIIFVLTCIGSKDRAQARLAAAMTAFLLLLVVLCYFV